MHGYVNSMIEVRTTDLLFFLICRNLLLFRKLDLSKRYVVFVSLLRMPTRGNPQIINPNTNDNSINATLRSFTSIQLQDEHFHVCVSNTSTLQRLSCSEQTIIIYTLSGAWRGITIVPIRVNIRVTVVEQCSTLMHMINQKMQH